MNHDDLIQRLSELRSRQEPEAPRALLDAAFPEEWASSETPHHHDLTSTRSGAIAASLLAASTLFAPILEPSASSARWSEHLQATSRQIVDRIADGGLLANPDQSPSANPTPESRDD
tara:strand:+ start:4874 stop:5224 length:351 start_codon:yes stop_codon:yes gene_type:complete